MSKIRPLPDDLQRIAIAELNEVPDRIPADIAALKEWIAKQPYLRARTDDQFLVAFLRGCKFSLEKAKSKIDKYYTLRTKYPDFYTIRNMHESRVMELIRLGIGLSLPTPLNGNGPRIMLIRGGGYPADKFKFEDVMCLAHTMIELSMLEDDYANVNGTIDVLDLSQVTAAHFVQMTPTVMKKMAIFAEEAMPQRQKASHFIHTPSAFEATFRIFKPLMPAKQQERLFVHGSNLEGLYKHIPQKYLPREYGGENGSIQEIIDAAEKKFLQFRDYFLDDGNYVTDEKLRPGESIDYDAVFGVEGSFRKLNVD